MKVGVDPAHCPRCLLLLRSCMCAEIVPRPTRTEIVILRHVGERWRSSNTGRVAARALAGSALIDFGDRAIGIDAEIFRAPGSWLVFPEGPTCVAAPAPPPARLIFLDATWHQARRMRQRVLALRGLPILHLAIDHVPVARLRESPGGSRVSTIEAIAAALRLCDDAAVADELERLFALHVARARASGRR